MLVANLATAVSDLLLGIINLFLLQNRPLTWERIRMNRPLTRDRIRMVTTSNLAISKAILAPKIIKVWSIQQTQLTEKA